MSTDWKKYWPPAPLPENPPREFKVGDVWASSFQSAGTVVKSVYRILSPAPADHHSMGEIEWLDNNEARTGKTTIGTSSTYAKHSIRVQENGQPPIPVNVLYGGAPPVPAAAGGGVKVVEWDPIEKTTDPVNQAHPVTGSFPRVVACMEEKRCYLCARKTPTYYERARTDRLPVCPICVTNQLGFDIAHDGGLTKRPEHKP